MKFMLMKIMMIMSSITMIMKNPMSMGFVLMVQTTLVVMLINKILYSSWFAMITFMMIIGGLLIMFMYMSSIASNEKFKIKFNMMIIIIIIMVITDEFLMDNQINENQDIIKTMTMNFSMTKLYNSKSMLLTMMLVMYLLLTMISVTKMVKHHKGPLRAMNMYE